MVLATTQCAAKAYDPRLIISWPNAKLAVMGGAQAAKTLLQIQIAAEKKKGKEISEADKEAMFNKIKSRYDKQTEAFYAAARLWVDAIIDPLETRKWISMGIEAADSNPITEEFKVGVIQT